MRISDWSSDVCSSDLRQVGVDCLADLQHFGVGQVLNAAAVVDAQLVGDVDGGLAADAVEVGERDDHALVGRDVDTCNTCHGNLYYCATGRLAPPHLDRKSIRLTSSHYCADRTPTFA